MRIKCFFLEPTEKVAVSLRRYSSSGGCPANNGNYHNAQNFITEEPIERDKNGYVNNGTKPTPDHDDPKWPGTCTCGYAFQESDHWQRFIDEVYKRTDTGEETTLRDVPPGAMWHAWWADKFQVPQSEHNLVVKTPGGEWQIDSQSSNCTMPDDRRQERHHCWIRHGDIPNITVDKNGMTCGAGAGSIQCGNYHGFLRNGYLED
jgi:hypothetical protein